MDESNRAGFRADIAFGKTASVLGNSQGTADDGLSLDETDLEVYQAYVQYLAPIAEEAEQGAEAIPGAEGQAVAQADHGGPAALLWLIGVLGVVLVAALVYRLLRGRPHAAREAH